MTLTIETARTGFIIRVHGGDSDGGEIVEVVADDDPALATFQMLCIVHEYIGHIGSRYDAKRVRIKVEHGDKYIKPGTPLEDL